jgi:hypothetical protein
VKSLQPNGFSKCYAYGFQTWGGHTVAKPKVFIGSSEANVKVANAIADGLDDCATVTVWDEGVFRLNDAFLQRLLAAPSQYDFAVMVWAPDDVTESRGQSQASPRDNVIFECGLFMGVLGLDHVFIVQDGEASIKIPSDFAGITLATYNGARMADDPQAAVRSACTLIKEAIANASCKELEGEWRERYMDCGGIAPKRVEADIEVVVFADTVSLVRYGGPSKEVLFEARGRLDGNRIRGEWHHKTADDTLAHGAFVLFLNTKRDVMYGYCVAFDPSGGALFEAWTLANKTVQTDDTFTERLAWGEETLRQRTVGLLITAVVSEVR